MANHGKRTRGYEIVRTNLKRIRSSQFHLQVKFEAKVHRERMARFSCQYRMCVSTVGINAPHERSVL